MNFKIEKKDILYIGWNKYERFVQFYNVHMKWKYWPQVGGTAYIDLLVPGNRPFATVGHVTSSLPLL